jgi:hypothetical protein
MTRKQWLAILRPLAGYSVLFLLGYIKGGVTVGLAFSMSFVAAHLNEFCLLRAIIKLVRGAKPTAFEFAAGACGIVTSVALVACGFGMVLALTTATYFILDAVLLRFR